MHTRDGARIACGCIRHGDAKDRKAILKAMKGYVGAAAPVYSLFLPLADLPALRTTLDAQAPLAAQERASKKGAEKTAP